MGTLFSRDKKRSLWELRRLGSVRYSVPRELIPVKAIWFSGRITSRTGNWWGDEEPLEDGTTVIKNYKFELDVFEIANGILIEKPTEVVSTQ